MTAKADPTLLSYTYSGMYYGPLGLGESAGGPTSLGQLELSPMPVFRTMSFDSVGVNHFATTGSAGTVFRIGIWRDDGAGPATLILDAGTVAMDTAIARKSIAISPTLVLPPGLYWVGGAGQVAGATRGNIARVASPGWGCDAWSINIGKGPNANFSVPNRGFVRASVTGAFASLTPARADFDASAGVDMFYTWWRAA